MLKLMDKKTQSQFDAQKFYLPGHMHIFILSDRVLDSKLRGRGFRPHQP